MEEDQRVAGVWLFHDALADAMAGKRNKLDMVNRDS